MLSLDLRRFRSYRGVLVRDLLRAIRNKVGGICHEGIFFTFEAIRFM